MILVSEMLVILFGPCCIQSASPQFTFDDNRLLLFGFMLFSFLIFLDFSVQLVSKLHLVIRSLFRFFSFLICVFLDVVRFKFRNLQLTRGDLIYCSFWIFSCLLTLLCLRRTYPSCLHVLRLSGLRFSALVLRDETHADNRYTYGEHMIRWTSNQICGWPSTHHFVGCTIMKYSEHQFFTHADPL